MSGASTAGPSLAIWVEKWQAGDGIFDPAHPGNRDDTYFGYRLLRERLATLGWRCHTQDVFQKNSEIPSVVLFPDLPRLPLGMALGPWQGKTKTYAQLIESPLVRPRDWKHARHEAFDRVFTWHSRLIGTKNYVQGFYAHNIPPGITLKRDLAAKTKLCVVIAGNKLAKIKSPLELYSERLKVIRWYEKNHPDDFDLYGTGWNETPFRRPGILRRLKLLGLAQRLLRPEPRPSYRGPISAKRPVLEKYRFNICFENARGFPGYVTEKMFDSLLGSCIPVYWGAPDVADFIPSDCFIDYREFGGIAEMHARLSSMPDDEYLGYIDRIEAFLRQAAQGPFASGPWIETLAGYLAADVAG